MGYTHYWRRPEKIPANKMEAIATDCKKVADYLQQEMGILLADGLGTPGTSPEFSMKNIRFNGSDAQPKGVWTTDEPISIPWPAPMASLMEISADPIAPKTDGQWFAGDLVSQRVAPLGNNGLGSGSYETFSFERIMEVAEYEREGDKKKKKDDPEKGLFFDCCKTAYRPYDLMITAALIIIKHHIPKVIVSTDGEEKDWLDARILCHNLLGYGFEEKVEY